MCKIWIFPWLGEWRVRNYLPSRRLFITFVTCSHNKHIAESQDVNRTDKWEGDPLISLMGTMNNFTEMLLREPYSTWNIPALQKLSSHNTRVCCGCPDEGQQVAIEESFAYRHPERKGNWTQGLQEAQWNQSRPTEWLMKWVKWGLFWVHPVEVKVLVSVPSA